MRISHKQGIVAAAFCLAAGWSRWLELRLADGSRKAMSWIWPVCFLLIGAILLFIVLGRQWILLPGLIMEAIPGINVFPFWVLVVGTVAIWGTARPKLKA
jgi:hypothetical protein